MKFRALVLCLLSFWGMTAFAGDIANYVNLGFSNDSRYFMFGQYGVSEDSILYAEIYTVDVPANKYASGGVAKAQFDVPLQPGQSGIGGLLTLLGRSSDLVKKYGINHMKPGRIIYVLVNGKEPEPLLEFRDFSSGDTYKIALKQSQISAGGKSGSSFYIDLTVIDKNGRMRGHTVGLPGYVREGVSGYRIESVFLSPDAKSMVFLVERAEDGPDGTDVRYMVETVKLL